MKQRCPWPADDKLMIKYHDKEWGVPLHNDRKLFEFLILEGFQAGLSWRTILYKRENFRRAFDNFDFNKVAKYDRRNQFLLEGSGIVRNKLKIEGAIQNGAFLQEKRIWNFR
jgi:DNA-3-methyladenine glycosylase I